jgi:hypothetical protein
LDIVLASENLPPFTEWNKQREYQKEKSILDRERLKLELQEKNQKEDPF